ncbi:MAG: YqjF family protein [Janthinobacterium lividum]
MSETRFLKAEWRNLIMINYEVDPSILKPYLPAATKLDLWQGKALVSMVGFMFVNTKVLGIRWPGHINFEEVNLRFYVRHFDGKAWKRGAVFISEIVPKQIIPVVANNIYNEHYQAMPMRNSSLQLANGETAFLYEWKLNNHWNQLGAVVAAEQQEIQKGSEEEFIFEHYWGYNRLTERKTVEYQVEHVSWKIRPVTKFIFKADVGKLYGKEFVPFLQKEPYSVFFAEGSKVAIRVAGKISA